MFRSEAQLARACRALCERVRLDGMWTDAGPTETAVALMEANGGPLSSGERIVLLAAWAVWNGHDGARLADVVYRLDGRNLHALGTLMLAVAAGGHAIDAWIAAMEDGAGASDRSPFPLPRR
jgi:hypothetical protein